jgi:hypothetical protein
MVGRGLGRGGGNGAGHRQAQCLPGPGERVVDVSARLADRIWPFDLGRDRTIDGRGPLDAAVVAVRTKPSSVGGDQAATRGGRSIA